MLTPCLSFPIPDGFQVLPLSFSRNLDRFNPNIPEWREDVGQVVTKILAKVRLLIPLTLFLSNLT